MRLWSYTEPLAVALLLLLGACARPVISDPHERRARETLTEMPSSPDFHPASNGLPLQGIWKSTPAVIDLNADGFSDLVALPRLGRGARVWLGNIDARWVDSSHGLELSGSCGGGVAAADLNRDGHLDLVVADHCDGVFVYLGDGQGRWTGVVAGLNPAAARRPASDDEDDPFMGAEDVAIGDVNEDGFLDLVVTASNLGGFSVYLGDGSAKAWKEITDRDGLPSAVDADGDDDQFGGWANRVLLADVDGDKHLDVVATYHAGPRVWRGNGTARWESRSVGLPSPQAGGVYRALALGDVNGDGRVDVVTTNMIDGVEVYLQTDTGAWRQASSPALSSVAGGATAVALGDVDGDGALDLVVGGRRGRGQSFGLFVFLGDGKGGWRETRTSLPSGDYPFVWGITVADVNRDGALDVVVATGFTAEPHPTRSMGRMEQPASGAPTGHQLQVWINARHGTPPSRRSMVPRTP